MLERKFLEELLLIDDIDALKKMIRETMEYYPKDEEYIVLKTFGFSNNYMYDKTYKKTQAYLNWCKIFKGLINQVKKQIPDIDDNKKIGLWLRFDHFEKFDVSNFIKAVQDRICQELGLEDNKVQIMECKTNKYITDVRDSRIYFYIKNL